MVNVEKSENKSLANYDSSDFDLSKVPEEKNLQKYLHDLRKLILEDKKLRCPMDDESLTYYIRGRKYNVARAFKSIKCSSILLSTSPECWNTLYPSAQADLFSIPDLITVSKCRSNGAQIVTEKIGLWDTTRFDAENILIASLLTATHLAKTSVETNITGAHIVFDLEGFSIYHLRYFTIRRIRKVITMMQDGFPIRIKGIHLLNNYEIVRVAFNLVKPFLKEKLRKRIIFHGQNYQESLCRALGRDAVPKSRGGNVPDDEYLLKDFFPELLTQDDYYKGLLAGGYGYGKFVYCKEFNKPT
jgi:hypothetical protein